MKKIELDKGKQRFLYAILTSVISMVVLFLSLLAISNSNGKTEVSPQLALYMFGIFLALCFSRIPLLIRCFVVEKNWLGFAKNAILSLAFLTLAILFLSLPVDVAHFAPLFGIYLGLIAFNRIVICFEKKKVASYIFNGFLVLILALLISAIPSLVSTSDFGVIVLGVLMILMSVSLMETLGFAFSSIQLKGILQIMRKTYAFEILYGMVVLIISCSFYFTIMEPTIETFGDGLWYSFAVVTTIGFGDVLATTLLVRILSVILSFYAAIVIAIITGVVVRYFQQIVEMKNKETIEAFMQELEHLPDLAPEKLQDLAERVRKFRNR